MAGKRKKPNSGRARGQLFSKRQLLEMRIAVLVTAVVRVGCGSALLIAHAVLPRGSAGGEVSAESATQAETQAVAETEAETEPPAEDTVIHLVAGGDINVTDKTVAAGAQASGYDYTEVFLDIMPVLASADLTVVNFEGNTVGTPYGSDTVSAPTELLDALKNAGVDLVQMANSKAIANGMTGLAATLEAISEAGMQSVGAYATNADFNRSGGYVIREVNGIRIAFVAFTKGMDGMGLPSGSESCVNVLYTDYNSTYQSVDTASITSILRNVQAAEPDITIALLHWGSEFNAQLSSSQETIRDLLLENGVSVILGTHSHYVQAVEYSAEDGTLIAYSLGDLLGDADKAGTNYSVLLNIEITKDGTTGAVSVTGYEYVPVYLDDQTESGGGIRILQVETGIESYENNSLSSISDEAYEGMLNALEKVNSRMG